jgi:polyphosphate kinase
VLDPRQRYLNREISELQFAERVLAIAEDPAQPLLDRVRFLTIVAQRLDDFFQIRVAGLKEQLAVVVPPTSPDGLTPRQQLREIRARVQRLVDRQLSLYRQNLLPQLAAEGIRICSPAELDEAGREHLTALFEKDIFPVLTPLAVDPAHPFPYISNLSLNLAVLVHHRQSHVKHFARVKVPPLLPRLLQMPESGVFVPLEQVLAQHLRYLFPGMDVLGHHFFRVTRDADLDLVEDGADDLLAVVQSELRRKRRQADVVRLEVADGMDSEAQSLLVRELDLEQEDVYVVQGPLDLSGFGILTSLDRPDLKSEPWPPLIPGRLGGKAGQVAVFDAVNAGDVLFQHPYESFAGTVEAFIEQAADDPDVLAIKQTLYRTSASGAIPRALVRAAESGKQVVAMVELKARGDEQANIAWAQTLEEAGVHVVYGLVGLKTHAKVALVVRREGGELRRYVHFGTGNYNPDTARAYEDIGLLTADQDLGADATDFFNYLTGYSRQRRYRKMLVSPTNLRTVLHRMIKRESKPGGYIAIKTNSLIDPEIIDSLYEAAARGARVELIVRTLCSLRPGVPGLSETITARSIVGRYLQHSRILRFGAEPAEADYFIGSADVMERNLDRRVEVYAPVRDPALRRRLAAILDQELRDDMLAWELQPDGEWRKIPTVEGVDCQRGSRDLALTYSSLRALG